MSCPVLFLYIFLPLRPQRPAHHVPISLAIFSASAALVATPPLGTPMPYCSPVSLRLRIVDSVCPYRFEQRSGAVFVYRQVALLLDSGLPQRCLSLRQHHLSIAMQAGVRGCLGPGCTALARTHVGCADGAGHRPTGAGEVVHGVDRGDTFWGGDEGDDSEACCYA